jgi:hypothetical protein
MKTSKIFIAFLLAIAVLVSQVGAVFAAPALKKGSISGIVTGLACETDPVTGINTFLVTVQSRTVRIDQSTADFLDLITVTGGIADCSAEALMNALGMEVTIEAADILHPVGSELAKYFDEITTYDAIMSAHDEGGFGFGVIAQALWLLQIIDDPALTLRMILDAKQNNDFRVFFPEGTENIPTNWGQFRKAVLDGAKKNNLGVVMSNNNGNNGGSNGNFQGNGQTHSNNHVNKNKHNENGNNMNNLNGGNGDKGNGHDK